MCIIMYVCMYVCVYVCVCVCVYIVCMHLCIIIIYFADLVNNHVIQLYPLMSRDFIKAGYLHKTPANKLVSYHWKSFVASIHCRPFLV